MLHGLQYTSDRWKENSFAFGFVWGWQTEQPYFRWVCNRSLCADPTSSKAEDVFPMAAYTNSPIKTCLSILVIVDRHNHTHYSHENKQHQWVASPYSPICLSVCQCTAWIPSAAGLGHSAFSSAFLGSKSLQLLAPGYMSLWDHTPAHTEIQTTNFCSRWFWISSTNPWENF